MINTAHAAAAAAAEDDDEDDDRECPGVDGSFWKW